MRLVLVGGGHAHLSVLRSFAKQRPKGIQLTLVTPFAHQIYSGMLPGWMVGHYTRRQCQVDLRPLAEAAGCRLQLDWVAALDADRHRISLQGSGEIPYELLSVDVGSETDTSLLAALGNKLLPIKPLDGFISHWPKVLALSRVMPGYKLVVVGAGAAGVEIALAAQYAFTSTGVSEPVHLVTSNSGMLPGHSYKVRNRVRNELERIGVRLHAQQGIGEEAGVRLLDGTLLKADCVIAATGARPSMWVTHSKIALDTRGYILVDSDHRSLSHPDIFAAGDICTRQDIAMERSGVHAVHAGPVLGFNLAAVANGNQTHAYRPRKRSLYLISCGRRYAIASWGSWSAEGRWAWTLKNWIDRKFIQKFSM